MQCPHCNAILPDDSKFCTICGQNFGQPAEEAQPVQPDWANVYVPTEPKNNKGLKKLIFLLAGIVVAVGLLIGVGVLTNWFGLANPVKQITTAMGNTAKAKSFMVTVEYTREYPEYENIRDEYSYNSIKKYIGMKTVKTTATYYVVLDHEEEDIKMYGVRENDDGDRVEVAIYDGYYITRYEFQNEDGTVDVSYVYDDYGDTIDAFFERPEIMKTITKEMRKGEPDYEEIYEGIVDLLFDGDLDVDFDDVEDYVEFDEVKGCVKDIWKQVNNKKWLKKNFDYKTETKGGVKLHKFQIEDMDFVEDLLELAKPAFEDRADYRDLMDELDAENEKIDYELTIGVKNNKLALYEESETYTYDDGKKDSEKKTMEFSHYNKTSINEKDLKALLEEAKAYEAEHNRQQSGSDDYYYGF